MRNNETLETIRARVAEWSKESAQRPAKLLPALKNMVAVFNAKEMPDPVIALATIEQARAAIDAAEHPGESETERFLRNEESGR